MRIQTMNDRRFRSARLPWTVIVPVVGVALAVLLGPAAQPGQGAEAASAPANAGAPAAAAGAAAPPAAAPAPAAAQPAPARKKYVPLAIDMEKRKDRSEVVNRILRGRTMTPDQQAMLDAYYQKYAFPLWTQPDQLNQLPKRRADLRIELSRKSGPAHDRLVQLALDFLGKMAKDPRQHPASRVNAMLAIGDLNSVESPGPTDLPVPLPEALQVLKDTVNDENQIDAVRVAALCGIYRHTVISVAKSGAADAEVSPMMLGLVQSEPPAGRSAGGHAWMRMRAMMTLAQIGALGDQNAVALALAGIVADQEDLFLARSAAARALGHLDYQGAQNLDPSDLGVKLAQLALHAGMAELTKMQEEDEEKARESRRTGRPGFMGPGMGYGMEMGMGMDYMGEEQDMSGGMEEMEEDYETMMGSGMMGSGYPGRTTKEEEEKDEETLLNRQRLMSRLVAVFVGFTKESWMDWARRSPDAPPTDGIAGLAAGGADAAAVGELLKGVEDLLEVAGAGDKETLLGIKEKEFSDEQEEAPFRELFRDELQKKLTALQETISKISPPPAAAPPPAAEPAPDAAPAAAPAGTTPPAAPAAAPPPAATPPAATPPAGNP